MPIEMRVWRLEGDAPRALTPTALPIERELHEMLERDPSLLGTPLLVIGSEVVTPHGKRIDLLAIDIDGHLHVLELKRDRTPREVVAQLLDYGSWVATLSREEIIDIANDHLVEPFEAAFEEVFGATAPDELNGERELTVVAAALDSSSERIIAYLRSFGVPINAVFFTYLEDDGRRYLARSWLTSADGVAPAQGTKSASKRAVWNGLDWYVSYGGDRSWEDATTYGFVSAGGGRFYSQTIRQLPIGGRVWACIPRVGYVGVGQVTGPAVRFRDAMVSADGTVVPLQDQPLRTRVQHAGAAAEDDDEWVVPIDWIDTRDERDAFWEKGMFANQHSACKLSQEFTLAKLSAHFNVDDL